MENSTIINLKKGKTIKIGEEITIRYSKVCDLFDVLFNHKVINSYNSSKKINEVINELTFPKN